jgi:hypothetical protein
MKEAKNQQWNVIYVDKAKKDPTKGMNEEFGFYINRPFYIVNQCPYKRVVEAVSAHHLKLKRYRKGVIGQQFIFDQKSKTVQSYW